MYEDGFVTLSTGAKVFYRCWTPENALKNVVAGVHGFAEHSGRYIHVGEELAANGYAFCMHDL